MQAGTLNRRVTLQSLVSAADATTGQVTDTWTDLVTIWAQIQPANAVEVAQAGQTEERITHYVTIRYRTDIGPQLRLTYNSRVFNIHRMLNTNEANREFVLVCEEIVRSGVGQG